MRHYGTQLYFVRNFWPTCFYGINKVSIFKIDPIIKINNMSLIMVRTTLFWFLHIITQLKWQRSRVPICQENQLITRALRCLQMFEIILQNIQLSCNHVMKCNILNGLKSNIVNYVLMRYISSKLLKTWPSWIGTSIILNYVQRYYLAVFIFYCSTSVMLELLK